MKRNTLIFCLLYGSVVAACGGVDSDLLSGSSDGGGGGDDDVIRDSGIRDGSISGKDSGSSDGGGASDSGSDGGIKPKGGIIQCGTNGTNDPVPDPTVVTCNASDPTCCVSQYPFDMVNPQSYRCTTSGVTCADFDSGSIPIECRSNADCSGSGQCCGHEVTFNTFPADPVTVYDSVRCQITCPLFLADGGENDNRLFCDPAASTNVCPVGESCGPSSLLPGFNVCGAP